MHNFTLCGGKGDTERHALYSRDGVFLSLGALGWDRKRTMERSCPGAGCGAENLLFLVFFQT